jgi:hypothetical protein
VLYTAAMMLRSAVRERRERVGIQPDVPIR